MNTGDEVYTARISVLPGTLSGAEETSETAYKIYPVPATTGLWIEMPESIGACTGRPLWKNYEGGRTAGTAESA